MKSSFFTFFLLLPLSLFSQEKCSRLTSWEKEILKHRRSHPLPRSIPEEITAPDGNFTNPNEDNDSISSNEESVYSFENAASIDRYASIHNLSSLDNEEKTLHLGKNKSTHNLLATLSKKDLEEIRKNQEAYDLTHPDTPSESPTPVNQDQNIEEQDENTKPESPIKDLPLPTYEQSKKHKEPTKKSKKCCIL